MWHPSPNKKYTFIIPIEDDNGASNKPTIVAPQEAGSVASCGTP